jgi:hypothetical protein
MPFISNIQVRQSVHSFIHLICRGYHEVGATTGKGPFSVSLQDSSFNLAALPRGGQCMGRGLWTVTMTAVLD